MKISNLLMIGLIQFLFLIGCETPTSSEPDKHILKGYGYVKYDGVQCTNQDEYNFTTLGDKLPSDFGCEDGDYVYFEAEKGYSNSNHKGGTTYWCKLIFMKKYKLR